MNSTRSVKFKIFHLTIVFPSYASTLSSFKDSKFATRSPADSPISNLNISITGREGERESYGLTQPASTTRQQQSAALGRSRPRNTSNQLPGYHSNRRARNEGPRADTRRWRVFGDGGEQRVAFPETSILSLLQNMSCMYAHLSLEPSCHYWAAPTMCRLGTAFGSGINVKFMQPLGSCLFGTSSEGAGAPGWLSVVHSQKNSDLKSYSCDCNNCMCPKSVCLRRAHAKLRPRVQRTNVRARVYPTPARKKHNCFSDSLSS